MLLQIFIDDDYTVTAAANIPVEQIAFIQEVDSSVFGEYATWIIALTDGRERVTSSSMDDFQVVVVNVDTDQGQQTQTTNGFIKTLERVLVPGQEYTMLTRINENTILLKIA